MRLFTPLSPEIRAQMDELIALIDEVFPLPRRFRSGLPRDVAELSRLFTSGRGDRSLSYLGKPNLLSAYLRYFLPWNVYRLCRLLPSLSLNLKDKDAIIDLGSGPLTLVLALWLCCPELRPLSLEFLCVDRTALVLEAGKKIFTRLAAKADSWKIRTIKGEISGKKIRVNRNRNEGFFNPGTMLHGKPAALVSAVNVFNEIFGEISPWEVSPANRNGLKNLAEQSAGLLGSCAGDGAKGGAVLVLEPGIPRSGEFISCLRASFLEQGLEPVSPCVHAHVCPFPGGLDSNKHKAKWCHFSFDTDDAPQELLKLSAAAGIPKERGVLSFLLVKKQKSLEETTVPKGLPGRVRIVSDAFPVGTYYSRYACSGLGSVLVRGSKEKIEALDSGANVELRLIDRRDPKTGARIGELV